MALKVTGKQRIQGSNATTGTGRSTFWCYVDMECRNGTATECDVYASYGVYVTKGDFYGSYTKSSWGKSGKLGARGFYLTKDAVKVGHFKYGGKVKLAAWAQYTAANGKLVKSSLSTNWAVPWPANGPLVAPSNVSAVRVSDSTVKVSWKPNGSATAAYIYQQVHMSTDGGAWRTVGSNTLSPTASSLMVTGLSAGHVYRFRVMAMNRDKTATSGATSGVSMTPTAPASVRAAATGKAAATLSVSGKCASATGLEWQYEANGVLSSVMAATSLSSVSIENLAGSVRFRARFTCGSLKGPWSAWTDFLIFQVPPLAPTLSSPVSSGPWELGEEVCFEWAHNPRDGSAQTAAQVRWTLDEEWTVTDIEGADSFLAVQNDFPVNAAVVWSARTMGASGEWGPWAGNRVFYIRKPPETSVSAPGPVVEAIPFSVEISYADESGEVAEVVVSIADEYGTVSFERQLGAATSTVIERGDWIPDEDAVYTLTARCRSTSGLSCECSMPFTVDYIEPKHVDMFCSFDEDTGGETVSIAVDATSEGSDVEYVELWRVTDGEEVLLAPFLMDGGEYFDKWCRVNRPFSYRMVVYAESGAIRTFERETTAETLWAYFFYGNEWEHMARAMLNPEESYTVTRPGQTEVRYAGRRYPVLYDNGQVAEEATFSALVETDEDAALFDDMARSWGKCVAKTLTGRVFMASVSVALSHSTDTPMGMKSASVTFKRIDGDFE